MLGLRLRFFLLRIFLPSAKITTDKTIIVWELQDTDHGDMGDGVVPLAGVPRRCLRGHSHFVEDVVISSDGQFALSASWDHTLRLWDIKKGVTTRRFVGHKKDVLSCAFSAENRQIVSGSRDKTVKLWNTLVRPCAIFLCIFALLTCEAFQFSFKCSRSNKCAQEYSSHH